MDNSPNNSEIHEYNLSQGDAISSSIMTQIAYILEDNEVLQSELQVLFRTMMNEQIFTNPLKYRKVLHKLFEMRDERLKKAGNDTIARMAIINDFSKTLTEFTIGFAKANSIPGSSELEIAIKGAERSHRAGIEKLHNETDSHPTA